MANNAVYPLNFGVKNGFGRSALDYIRSDRSNVYVPSQAFWWLSPIIEYTDLTAAALSEELDLNTLAKLSGREFPSSVLVKDHFIHLIEEFAGGGATSATAALGDTGDPDKTFLAESVFTGVGAGIVKTADGAAFVDASYFASNDSPTLTIASDVNVNTFTAGKLRVAVLLEGIAALAT